jgi:hypothetical protein
MWKRKEIYVLILDFVYSILIFETLNVAYYSKLWKKNDIIQKQYEICDVYYLQFNDQI